MITIVKSNVPLHSTNPEVRKRKKYIRKVISQISVLSPAFL